MKRQAIFGPERFSKEFQEDLRVLLKLNPKIAAAMAIEYATSPSFDEEDLVRAVGDLDVAPEKVEPLARILLFYAKSLMRERLPRVASEEFESQLTSLGLEERERQAFREFVEILSAEQETANFQAARTHWLRVGCARVESARAACDLRCVYELAERQDEARDLENTQDNEPRPGRLLRIEPVVLLEFETELNEVKENHVFQLTEKELLQLIRILRRAAARCTEAKRVIRQEEASNLVAEKETE